MTGEEWTDRDLAVLGDLELRGLPPQELQRRWVERSPTSRIISRLSGNATDAPARLKTRQPLTIKPAARKALSLLQRQLPVSIQRSSDFIGKIQIQMMPVTI